MSDLDGDVEQARRQARAVERQDSGSFDAPGPNGVDPEKKDALRGPMLA